MRCPKSKGLLWKVDEWFVCVFCFSGQSVEDDPKEANPEFTLEQDAQLIKVSLKLILCYGVQVQLIASAPQVVGACRLPPGPV